MLQLILMVLIKGQLILKQNCFDMQNYDYSSQYLLFNVQYSHMLDNDRLILI